MKRLLVIGLVVVMGLAPSVIYCQSDRNYQAEVDQMRRQREYREACYKRCEEAVYREYGPHGNDYVRAMCQARCSMDSDRK